MLDKNYIIKLGGVEFMDQYIPIFLKSCRSSINELNHNISNKDWEKVILTSHKLVGTLSTIGNEQLVTLITTLKENTKQNDLELIPQLNEFRRKFFELEKHLLSNDYKNCLIST